ncbi:unnamed protein product [Lota lota]
MRVTSNGDGTQRPGRGGLVQGWVWASQGLGCGLYLGPRADKLYPESADQAVGLGPREEDMLSGRLSGKKRRSGTNLPQLGFSSRKSDEKHEQQTPRWRHGGGYLVTVATKPMGVAAMFSGSAVVSLISSGSSGSEVAIPQPRLYTSESISSGQQQQQQRWRRPTPDNPSRYNIWGTEMRQPLSPVNLRTERGIQGLRSDSAGAPVGTPGRLNP